MFEPVEAGREGPGERPAAGVVGPGGWSVLEQLMFRAVRIVAAPAGEVTDPHVVLVDFTRSTDARRGEGWRAASRLARHVSRETGSGSGPGENASPDAADVTDAPDAGSATDAPDAANATDAVDDTPDADRADGGGGCVGGSAAEVVAAAASVTGVDLAVLLERLDLNTLDEGDAVDAVVAWGRVISYAQAKQGQAAARLEQRLGDLYGLPDADATRTGRPGTGVRRSTMPRAATEVAMCLGLTRQGAATLVRTAMMLNGPLFATGEALETGRIDARKADLIAGNLDGLPVEVTTAVEDEVLPTAAGRTPPQLSKDLTAAIVRADPDGAAERHRAARAKRRVNHPRALPDQMATLTAVLPIEDALCLDLALDGAAKTARADGDARTTDQLRADILTSIGANALRHSWIGPLPPDRLPLTDSSTHSSSGASNNSSSSRDSDAGNNGEADNSGDHDPNAGASTDHTGETSSVAADDSAGEAGRAGGGYRVGTIGGAPVQLRVTVPLSTLLGGDEPGDLDGAGPIDALKARALALQAPTWQRLVTDPMTGTVIDIGRTRYKPPADLARLVRERDRTCVRPGCNTRATACDLDHTTPFAHGGITALINLEALCIPDHRHKTLGDYRVIQHPGGVFDWISKTGHTYRREANGTTTHHGRATPPPPKPPAQHQPEPASTDPTEPADPAEPADPKDDEPPF
ncbi:HNH endonuclease signature motif containing protein [Georgenia halophila]